MTEKLWITSRTDWTPELITQAFFEIEKIAKEELELIPGIDLYPNSIEIISSEQMLDAYSSIGLPIHYNHWSFGKDFLKNSRSYQKGRSGLAYEIVINTNPCISYLMEENDMLMQTMVMAHAAIGHNAVFKNNECFKQWTNPGSIIDYMIFARDYIRQCEDRYGEEEVEDVIDAAHALAPHGVDKFKRKHRPTLTEEARIKKLLDDEENKHKELDIIMQRTSYKDVNLKDHDEEDDIEEEENLLYFIMKNSPSLPQWKREIIRIVYKVNQYFYPQGQCVTGDNLVSTGHGLLRLDELIKQDGYVPASGISVLTTGDRFTLISHTYKKSAKVVRVKTVTGREYIGTPEHPLMGLQATGHGVIKLGELKLGDHLVLNTNYSNVFAKNEVPLEPPAHRQVKSVNYPTKFPTTITVAMGTIIGHLQSMTISEKNVFSATHPALMSSKLKEVFGLDGDNAFSSWGLKKFIEQLDLVGVPRCIRQSPVAVVMAYLKARIDARAVERTHISTFKFNTYDKEEAAHLQVMLGALAIIVSVKEQHWAKSSGLAERLVPESTSQDKATLFCLQVLPSSKQKFEEVIGSDLDLPCFDGNSRVASDIIPEGDALLSQLTKLLDVSSSCFYDRVILIEELDEEREVYDVTVPENHLFWMSGLISHNTKTLNEGFATFCHYYIMTRMEEKGFLSSDAFIAFLNYHSGVIYQPEYSKSYYSGPNPYTLGFKILMDVKRICENPTAEDKEWFPQLIGKRWQDAVKDAAFEYRDDGFIAQYLSPNVIRDMKMFSVQMIFPEDEDDEEIPAIVTEIHDDVGYKNIRNLLAQSMERINFVPQIIVVDADLDGDRILKLQYKQYMGRTLEVNDADLVTDHIDSLWGYAVELSC